MLPKHSFNFISQNQKDLSQVLKKGHFAKLYPVVEAGKLRAGEGSFAGSLTANTSALVDILEVALFLTKGAEVAAVVVMLLLLFE